MNNWRAIGYIFLGFGTVFLVLALFTIFGLLYIFSWFSSPELVSIPVSLVASAPWLVLASLMYIVGVVGYYAGRENPLPPRTSNKVDEDVSSKLSPYWSLPIGALTTLSLLLALYFSGITNNSNAVFGLILPITISMVAGIIVGFASNVIINND